MNKKSFINAKELSRDLRKRSTSSEQIFWNAVRNKKISGKKFLRQHPIIFNHLNKKHFFIADYYCHENRLVIEIDGKIHDNQKKHDEMRSYIINNLGITLIRFRNEEIENNTEKVLAKLNEKLIERTPSKSLSF
jgi:very-short-patch-repair endonuclease